MTARGGRLVFAMSIVGVLSCSEIRGHSMKGGEKCLYMPTIEECQSAAASLITDECLRDCVIKHCKEGYAFCGEKVMATCSKLTREHPEGETGGYVYPGTQTCERPKPYVNWCQIGQSPPCQALSMVHERAHACGWDHGDGMGVPGDDKGRIIGCKSPSR